MAATRPPGAFPTSTTTASSPTSVPGQTAPPSSKSKKKKNKNKKKGGAAGVGGATGGGGAGDGYGEDDDDLPPLEDTSLSLPLPPLPNGLAGVGGTPGNPNTNDLLTTASDLYRQIEAAAASALSTHPSFASAFPPPPNATNTNSKALPNTTDEAYWTSLPSHLRAFIRSALPLAAGIGQPPGSPGAGQLPASSLGANGQLPALTHEQLSVAAAQLAQVVQANWNQLGLGSPPLPGQAGAGQGRMNAFHGQMPTREQVEAAISSMGGLTPGSGPFPGFGQQAPLSQQQANGQEEEVYEDTFDLTEDEGDGNPVSPGGGDGQTLSAAQKKKNKKKKKKAGVVAPVPVVAAPLPTPAPTPAPISNPAPTPAPARQNLVKSTNGTGRLPGNPTPTPAPYSVAPKPGPSSERDKIRDFWLGLKEDERRALVKVEKDAVLRKMKEQQRSGCSCAVCGRKRSAIEEELEVLYDAYYDELESYALHQARSLNSGGTIAPPPGPGPFPGSVDSAPPLQQPAQTALKGDRKGAVVKTTRDHKNVRPASNANKKKPVPPPATNGTAPANNGPAHGEPGHNHSQSCPHHPHNHSHTGHNHPHPNPANGALSKNKGNATVEENEEDDYDEDDYDDEEEEEEDDDEYDEEEEEEYDDDDDSQADDHHNHNHAHPHPHNHPHNHVNSNKKQLAPTQPAPQTTKKQQEDGNDFFGFGKSLTVKGGILTVADDLLKNDGQKFLEMMEQLADKRIQREREAADGVNGDSDDEEGYDDEEDEEEDEEDDEEDDDDGSDDDGSDEEEMTDAERMEEGRRMFQIFAARMFEQRVLTAYRERVAKERQDLLLKELAEEERLAEERELKKAKENQKKKDKKKDQKQKKEEERLRKEAEKAAAEQTARQAEEARLEDERRRNEEQRAKRETERKLKEEERQKREEKLRQAKEDERLKKEEKLRLAKEARLAQEKEQREKKAKEDAERRAKEAAEKKEREEREEKERIEREEKEAAAAKAQAAAQAAARAKLATPRSPPASRSAALAKPLSIPGLPKAPIVGSKPAAPPSQPPVRQQPSSFPPGVTPRQPSGTASAQQQQSPASPAAAPRHVAPQQAAGPPFAQRSPAAGQSPNGLPPSRMFSPTPIGGQTFGSVGLQQQASSYMQQQNPGQQPQVSPGLNRSAPIGPPPIVTSGPGVLSPIAPPQAPAAVTSPSLRPTSVGPIGGIIGRSPSTVTNARSSSPPPRVFGSSALLEDDEVVEPTRNASSSGWSSPFSSGGGIWGAPATPVAAPAPPPIAPVVTPDRTSVIRDRARVSYVKLMEFNTGPPGPVSINDLHSALVTLWADSSSVSLTELVTSMLQEGTITNGGGAFSFTQSGDQVFTAWRQ